MNRRLTQRLAGALVQLLGKVSLEGHRLLTMESLEAAKSGINLEAPQRLRGGIQSRLASSLRFLEVGEIAALRALVVSVVFRHGLGLGVRSHGLGRVPRACLDDRLAH